MMYYDEAAVDLVRHALLVTLMIGAPILAAGVIVGLIISLLQSVTSIQDQTIAFVPKIIVMIAALIVLTPWIISKLAEYASSLLSLSP